MPKLIYYRQCHLKKKASAGHIEQTSYIPEEFAYVNKILKLKDLAGIWENGWRVERVGLDRIEESSLPDSHNEIKAHRKSTGDISSCF